MVLLLEKWLKEENYNTRRSNLIKEFNRKQKEIEKQLYKIRESKEGERKNRWIKIQGYWWNIKLYKWRYRFQKR